MILITFLFHDNIAVAVVAGCGVGGNGNVGVVGGGGDGGDGVGDGGGVVEAAGVECRKHFAAGKTLRGSGGRSFWKMEMGSLNE